VAHKLKTTTLALPQCYEYCKNEGMKEAKRRRMKVRRVRKEMKEERK
jgi:hypothetical protein